MTLSSFIQRAADVYPHKRALTYLDGKGKETDIQTFAEVSLGSKLLRMGP
jgi:acyl-CoA synthetase (AMP-forming)/AMP-acid ligase II